MITISQRSVVSFICLGISSPFSSGFMTPHHHHHHYHYHYHYHYHSSSNILPSLLSSHSTTTSTSLSNTNSNDNNDNQSNQSKLTNQEIGRYSRHLVLPSVGINGQTKFKNSRVLVIGAGGLGSPCLLYLAAAGVGHIGIIDADTVDESNLQRQIIHGTGSIGLGKCDSAKRRIGDVNPLVEVTTFEEEFTAATAMRILTNGNGNDGSDEGQGDGDMIPAWDVVVDGSDNFPTKYLINDACEILNIPWVYSAILGFEGQISVFNYNNNNGPNLNLGPTYRDMMPVPPPPGDVPSCAEGGVLGVLPGTMGCLQATEVLKILLGTKESTEGLLVGRVLIYDAMNMRFSEAGVERLEGSGSGEDGEGREEITELIDYQGFCAGPSVAATATATDVDTTDVDANAKGGRTMDEAESDDTLELSQPEFKNIPPQEALQKLKTGWSPWVLDVRLQTEHDIVALPFTDVVSPFRTVGVDEIPMEGDVLVYCKAGIRGKKACVRLIGLGVDPERLYNLDGGIMRWRSDIDTSMPKY